MTKLQEIKRKNGTTVNVLYIPNKVIEEAGLFKGDVVSVVVEASGVLRVTKV